MKYIEIALCVVYDDRSISIVEAAKRVANIKTCIKSVGGVQAVVICYIIHITLTV